MSEFNIRDYRNSHQDEEAESKDKLFWTALCVIPVLALVGGLAWNPIMEMRSGNVEMLAQAQIDAEAMAVANAQAKAQAGPRMPSTPWGAAAMANAQMAQLQKNENGLIDLNGKREPSAKEQRRRDYRKNGLKVKDYILANDAKAEGFSANEIKVLKYERAEIALGRCGFSSVKNYYVKNNKSRYEKLKMIADLSEDDRRKAASAKLDGLRGSQSELSQVKTKADAMKLVATGGARRHMNASMSAMSGMGAMSANMDRYDITRRRQTHGQKHCVQIRTMAQSGALNI